MLAALLDWPTLSPAAWALALAAAFSSGVAKAGLTGTGMLGVVLMALAIPGRESSGVVLPLLIMADVLAVSHYRAHIDWAQIRRLLGPIVLGILGGWLLMQHMPDAAFRPVLGWIILGIITLHWWREYRHAQAFQPTVWVARSVGVIVGITTMMANAAGPIATVYLLALGLTKNQFVHTMAWLFFIVNLIKIPFSFGLGLIHPGSITLNLLLLPMLLLGFYLGGWLVRRLSREKLATLVIGLAVLSAVRLIIG
jgi:hypothetical protein